MKQGSPVLLAPVDRGMRSTDRSIDRAGMARVIALLVDAAKTILPDAVVIEIWRIKSCRDQSSRFCSYHAIVRCRPSFHDKLPAEHSIDLRPIAGVADDLSATILDEFNPSIR